MQRYIILSILTFSFLIVQAQFGIAAVFTAPQTSFADGNFEDFLDDGLEFSANYWFRLKEKRIEFLPTVSYAKYNYTDLSLQGEEPIFPASYQEIGFQLHTRIYPFDFGTDCDCPTFGKQAPALEKGFFLQLSPGVSWLEDTNSIAPADQALEQKASAVLPTIGLAVGLDFGLSNLVTISPIAGVRYAIGDAPNALEYVVAPQNNDKYGKFFAGIHLGIRLDEKRY